MRARSVSIGFGFVTASDKAACALKPLVVGPYLGSASKPKLGPRLRYLATISLRVAARPFASSLMK